MVSTVVSIGGAAGQECRTFADATVEVGRDTVREKGQASYAALTVRVPDDAASFVAPFDPVAVTIDGATRFSGHVAEVDLQHERMPDGTVRATQRIAAVGALASWGATTIGEAPWPAETVAQRAQRIAAVIGQPIVVQGGSDQMVAADDVDSRTGRELLDELAHATGGWVFDRAGTVYLQAMTARKIDVQAVTWDDEPVGKTWDDLCELDPLLAEAVWRVDPGRLTDDGLGLADLSGNGRDAVFGAGAAKPVVLDHYGDDYLCFYRAGTGTAQYIQTGLAVGGAPIIGDGWYIEWDQEWPAGAATQLHFVIYADTTGVDQVRVSWDGPDLQVQFSDGAALHGPSFAVADGLRHTYRAVIGLDAVELFIDGVSQGGPQATGYTRTPVAPDTNFFQMSGTWTEPTKLYGAALYDGTGAAVWTMDPSRVASDYTTIPSDGYHGSGNSRIVRAASGFKTAVVDRPLLLFGGKQQAVTASEPDPIVGNQGTVVAVMRSWSDTATSRWIRGQDGETPADGVYAYFNTNATESVRSNPATVQTFATPYGQRAVAWTYDGSAQRAYLDGAYRGTKQGVSSAPMFANYVAIGSGVNVSMEFIAAAIFDRALTDDEVAEVSDLLLGTGPCGPTWQSEDENPYRPIDLDGCYIRWAPTWVATHEIANAVAVTYNQGTDRTVVVEDADSIARYGRHEIALDSMFTSAADALEMANLVLERNKLPRLAFTDVTVDMQRVPAQLRADLLGAAPGTRITIHGLPRPSPQTAFNGVLEGWTDRLYPDGHEMTMHISDVRHSLAVPVWDELDPARLWDDEPAGESWESEFV